jgi:hypothetical protein
MEWEAPLQFPPNLDGFSFDGYYHFRFHRHRNSVCGLNRINVLLVIQIHCHVPQPDLGSRVRGRTRPWCGARHGDQLLVVTEPNEVGK